MKPLLKKTPIKTDSEQPTSTWQAKKGWKTKTISSQILTTVVVLWIVTSCLVVINCYVFTRVSIEIDLDKAKDNKELIAAAVFFLVSLLVIFQTLSYTFRYWRFGKVVYVMDPYPGAIGGHIGGYIEVKKLYYDDVSGYEANNKVTLECVYSYMSGSGKDRSRKESVEWAECGNAKLQRSSQGVMFSFRFDIPENLPESAIEEKGDYYFWRLTIKADLPGFDLNRNFNIPVFATGEHSRYADHDLSAEVAKLREQASLEQERAIQQGNFHLTDIGKVAKIEYQGSELQLYFPMFRNKVLTVFALIFSVGFGFAFFGINSSFGSGGLMNIFSFVFSIPFGLVSLFATIAAIYLPLNNLHVLLNRERIKTTRRLLFLPVGRKTLPVSDVSGLSIKKTGSTGQGVKKIEHFKVVAETRHGKTITIAEDIDGEDLASHLKNYLAWTIGISELFT